MKNSAEGLSGRFIGGVKKYCASTAAAVFLVSLLISLAVQFFTGNFYTTYNILTFTRQVSFTIIVAFGQTLVLLLGGIDLSVASIAGFCSMTVAMLSTQTSLNPFLCVLIALAAGTFLGLTNGAIICGLKLTPFIVTLATGSLFKGIVYVVTQGNPITGVPSQITQIGQGSLFKFLPYPTILMLLLFIVLTLVLKYLPFGRHIFAIGGNEIASKIVGIRTNKIKLMVYALSGFFAGFAGILMVLRLGASQVNVGENWVMPSITAAILGGTSMSGGMGSIAGTIAGGLLMGVISFSIGLTNISSYWEEIVTGGVVIIAVAIDAIRRQKKGN
ncbi:MAG: Ribose/xylose/arabinose/galactoside ABC-type transport system, permease component [Caproiciproducens sp.]|jgi:ribose transport system permease protein|nr:Ribose/xylose/arabinose/galactoside ABC-type transport system, permease component [Caproiciproducens sp.]